MFCPDHQVCHLNVHCAWKAGCSILLAGCGLALIPPPPQRRDGLKSSLSSRGGRTTAPSSPDALPSNPSVPRNHARPMLLCIICISCDLFFPMFFITMLLLFPWLTTAFRLPPIGTWRGNTRASCPACPVWRPRYASIPSSFVSLCFAPS